MVEKYKIPKEQVVVVGIDGHGNTLGNIADVVDFFKKNDFFLTHHQLGLLTNEWHIARTLFMFTRDPFFFG